MGDTATSRAHWSSGLPILGDNGALTCFGRRNPTANVDFGPVRRARSTNAKVAFRSEPPYAPRLQRMRFLERTDRDYESTLQSLSRRSAAVPHAIEDAAREVIATVRSGGDAAIRALTEKFEGRKLTSLELDRTQWRAQAANVEAPVLAALERAAERIEAFHERERYPSFEMESAGARVGSRVTPLGRIGEIGRAHV